jgi:hypothetical protein
VQVPLKLLVRDQLRRNVERLSRPVRIARAYPEYTARRQLAAGISGGTFDVQALEQQGFLVVPPHAELVGTLIEASRRRLAEAKDLPQSRGKAFFSQLLTPADLALDGPFMQVALDETILKTTARYLGVAPYLESVELLYSKPIAGAPAQSQQWHKDRTDRRIVKVFVYINEVTRRHGPLSLLPAADSRRVPEFLFHYLTDEQMAQYVDLSRTVAFTGPAGTTVFIDSQTCYHLGSRCKEPRLAYVAYYTSGFGYRPRETTWRVPPSQAGLSAVQQFALGLR